MAVKQALVQGHYKVNSMEKAMSNKESAVWSYLLLEKKIMLAM
jgi:hypothetical protein